MKAKERNWIIGFVCALPMIAMFDLYVFTEVMQMIRQKSDMGVVIGVSAIPFMLIFHYLVIKLILTKSKIMKKSALVILFACALSACTRIDAGYEGILIKQYGTEKGVQDVQLVTGRVTYNPWIEDVEQMPTFVQTADYDLFTVNAKDGSVFKVDPTISIRIIPGSAPSIFTKYRKDIDEIIKTTLYNYVKDAFRIQFNKYTTDEITSKREEFENNVQNYLTQQLEKEGFHLEQLTSGLAYPDMIVAAINAKNEAVQTAMKIENQLKAAEATARINIANAEGNAKSLVIQAKADAEANKLRQQSLTTLLIQQQFIEKWNGELPVYGTVPQLFKDISKQ